MSAVASTVTTRRRLIRRLGAILWPSFFSAGVCTMVFFALVDPIELRELTFPQWSGIGRELGYTIGFFMFWLANASSSLFTWLLLRRQVAAPPGFPVVPRPARKDPDPSDEDEDLCD